MEQWTSHFSKVQGPDRLIDDSLRPSSRQFSFMHIYV